LQLFLIVAALWVAWRTLRTADWKHAFVQTAVFTLVVSSLLLPWLLGNVWVHGEFSLAPGFAQSVYFYGNSPEILQMYRATTKEEYYRLAEKINAFIMIDSKHSPEDWMRPARDFQRNQTRDWLKLQLYKVRHFWTPWLNPLIFSRRDYLLSLVSTTPLFLLAGCELWRRRRVRDPFLTLLLGVLGVGYLVGGLLFHVEIKTSRNTSASFTSASSQTPVGISRNRLLFSLRRVRRPGSKDDTTVRWRISAS